MMPMMNMHARRALGLSKVRATAEGCFERVIGLDFDQWGGMSGRGSFMLVLGWRSDDILQSSLGCMKW